MKNTEKFLFGTKFNKLIPISSGIYEFTTIDAVKRGGKRRIHVNIGWKKSK